MTINGEVISAFLDDEAFEPQELSDALSHPAGRELLIDLVLLRHVAQSDESAHIVTAAPVPRPKRPLYALAAAAVLVALLGGYHLGQQQSAPASQQPPAATRVVQAEPVWQEVGGVR
jgi:hypothetical protein